MDHKVKQKLERRQFTVEYKQCILFKADNYTRPGQIGALLHWEGFYSSNITQGRQQRSEGLLRALIRSKPGPKVDPLVEENAALRHRIDLLEAEMKRAETIIEVQKVSELIGLSEPSNPKSDESK